MRFRGTYGKFLFVLFFASFWVIVCFEHLPADLRDPDATIDCGNFAFSGLPFLIFMSHGCGRAIEPG